MRATTLVCILIIQYATALTQWELDQFAQFSPNITYTRSFNRRIGASVIRFRTKSLPHYYTTEYPEIDLTAITTMTVYANPAVADATGCLKRGPVGLAYNGVPFLNVYYTTGYNSVAAEFTNVDQCKGHVGPDGMYHVHGVPWCSEMVDEVNIQPDQFMGVALDGFPIYGPFNATGNEITNSQLNDCHGETYVNDEGQTSFRYRLTREFPYTLGCVYGKTLATLGGQYCIKPYMCGENPGNMSSTDPLYTECGGPWPTTQG